MFLKLHSSKDTVCDNYSASYYYDCNFAELVERRKHCMLRRKAQLAAPNDALLSSDAPEAEMNPVNPICCVMMPRDAFLSCFHIFARKLLC